MAGARSDDSDRPRDELLAELNELREYQRQTDDVVHDLRVHQEELDVQQRQLLESQRSLEEARDRYAELFDFAPVGYLALDRHGVIREANLKAAAMFHTERLRMIGMPLHVYIGGAHRRLVLDMLAKCRRTHGRAEAEVVREAKDGERALPLSVVIDLIGTSAGEAPQFQAALIDLTELRRTEDERAAAREERAAARREEEVARAASEAKDRFLALLSHELRTPLTPILFGLEALHRQGEVPEWIEPTLAMVRRNVLLETRLIEDLLDVTRIVQGRMSFTHEVVDLHALVTDTVDLCRQQAERGHLEVRTALTAPEHHVRADPVRVQQVVWNLLNNAVRNTPAGGTIDVRTAGGDGKWIELTITDNGRGIEPAMLPRIFTLFEPAPETRRRGIGLGVGLPISRSIVEAHGGRLTAASDGNGHGARFTVELPTVSGSVPRQEAQPSSREMPASVRVLLVEDNEDSATAIAELLRAYGYEVVVATTIHEALQHIDTAEVLLSDIALPDGTGHDLLRQASERHSLPAIALSGYGGPEDRRRSQEAGFVRHLVKPVDPRLLLDALQQVLSS